MLPVTIVNTQNLINHMNKFRRTKINNEDKNDLGFGARLSQNQHRRLLNRDGTFNVQREGMSLLRSNSAYHMMLTISWPNFYLVVAAAYGIINLIFGVVYFLLGAEALNGAETTTMSHFWNSFFFSVETFATIGYGSINPRSFEANWIMTLESFLGLVFAAMATGLLFARFSKPNAKILYSDNGIIAPFKDGRAFMFRMINLRSSQLIQVEAEVIYSHLEEENGKMTRRYHKLKLEREKVMFFPLHWTVVHHIDETSPLYHHTERDMKTHEAEFMILVNAVDETYSQTVYSRSSYRYDEIVWGAKFKNMFHEEKSGVAVGVKIDRLHEYEFAPLD
jgi:inward rectifier potassium channel